MIGNDIIDLKRSSSNWKRTRFLDKVFTSNEQNLIFNSENQHQMVWLLWSMKEAAYKAHVQRSQHRFFNPKRLACALISEAKGTIVIDSEMYITSSIITKDYIYTTSNLKTQKTYKSSIFKTEGHSYFKQSVTLKTHLLASLAKSQDIEIDTLDIKKTSIGIPEVFQNSVRLPIHISLTHCGRFSGFMY